MRRKQTRESKNRELDRAEARLEAATGAAVRHLLTRLEEEVQKAVRSSAPLDSLAAASTPEYPPLGAAYGWWDEAVEAEVIEQVQTTLREAYAGTSDATITDRALSAEGEYLSAVRDRLVRGIEPPLPEEAFNLVRQTVATANAQGWDRHRLSQRIANELSWEANGDYWRQELDRVNSAIDSVLDPLGPPGAAAREMARLNDPGVALLQEQRAHLVSRLDAERSYWETRAMRIARTESTGASSYGTLVALQDEGASGKEWLATLDTRTRDAHAAVDGQVVPLDQPFIVDGYEMMMPGSPTAPARLVVNCRCLLLGAEV